MRDDVMLLIPYLEDQQDEYGNDITPEGEPKEVFCKVKSAERSEFFMAAQSGMKASYKVEVFEYDYENEEIAEFRGERFFIYRTFLLPNSKIELYLGKKAGQ